MIRSLLDAGCRCAARRACRRLLEHGDDLAQAAARRRRRPRLRMSRRRRDPRRAAPRPARTCSSRSTASRPTSRPRSPASTATVSRSSTSSAPQTAPTVLELTSRLVAVARWTQRPDPQPGAQRVVAARWRPSSPVNAEVPPGGVGVGVGRCGGSRTGRRCASATAAGSAHGLAHGRGRGAGVLGGRRGGGPSQLAQGSTALLPRAGSAARTGSRGASTRALGEGHGRRSHRDEERRAGPRAAAWSTTDPIGGADGRRGRDRAGAGTVFVGGASGGTRDGRRRGGRSAASSLGLRRCRSGGRCRRAARSAVSGRTGWSSPRQRAIPRATRRS